MIKIRIRAVVGIMIFLGYFLMYNVRNNLSVHIIGMAHLVNKDEYNYHFGISNNTNLNNLRTRVFDAIIWDSMKIGKLLSAYHIGYCVCFPIFHSFGDKLGPTWVVGISGFISGVLCCLTPAAAYYNFWVLFLVRIIKGFCAGAMQPSMVQVLRNWVPPTERNHFMWAYCGFTMGTSATFLLCAAVHYYSKWPVGFYLSGGFQILWAIVWVLVITDSPRKHPCISEEELTYLINTIGAIFTIKLTNSHTPWALILKSRPFWALCVLNFGYSWMLIALCIHGPLYYCSVEWYKVYNASVITAIPFLFRLVLGTILIHIFHYYKHRPQINRITHIRKYFIIVSHVIPGFVISVTWLLPVVPGPVLLSIAVALTAAGMDLTLDLCHVVPVIRTAPIALTKKTGCVTISLLTIGLILTIWDELTPTFVNSINTVIKIIGNTSGIIISLCVGQVTEKHKNLPHVWKNIWCFHAAVLLLSGIIFLIWGDTNVQPWNFKRSNRLMRQFQHKPSSTMSDIIEVEEDRPSCLIMTETLNLR